jgi:O-antigen/teichoic acid export membrane protein
MDNNLRSLKRLAHGAGIVFVFSLSAYLFMFLFKLTIARYFGPNEFGLFNLAEAILGILSTLALVGIDYGIARYIPIYETKGEKSLLKGYLNFIFKIPLLSSLILTIFILLSAPLIKTFFDFPNEFVLMLRIFVVILPFHILNSIFAQIFLAKNKVLHQNISKHLIETGLLLVGALLIVLLKLNIYYLVLFFIIPKFLSFIYNMWVYKSKINFQKTENKIYHWKEWIHFSLPLLFMSAFSYIISWTDNLVIGKFLEPKNLGVYAVAFSLSRFLLMFVYSFKIIFMPIISERYANKDRGAISFLFKKSQNWMFGLALPIALFLFFFAKDVLNFLYGARYISGALSIKILVIGFMINLYAGLVHNILILHKKTKSLFKISLFAAIMNIILNIVMVPVFGIIGAAISSTFSISLLSLFYWYKARKLEKLNFDLNVNLKFFVSGVFGLIIIKIFTIIFNFNDHLKLILMGLLYIFIYLMFLLLFKTFDKSDIQIMLAIEKKLGINLGFIKKIISKINKF